ncbi:uncharacterized protein LOC119092522 [Pollicipes pollicipes]|uniref:uncharacterized protein LOC119092522 n=1 Tax=Pollicipes pollicipes TaxID=41117 RepID=UPI001885797C|nr:uncharacterized protein LOC119092522 [Pollicipes pollicipes]
MVKEHKLSIRYRAVGMVKVKVKGGMTQLQVTRGLGVNEATVRCWLARDRSGDTLENRTSRGQKSALSRVAKMVIAKSVFKRHHSTRTLARKLAAEEHTIYKSAVHRYLNTSLQLKSFKLRMQPRLTVGQKRRRLEFTKDRKNWSMQDWKRVLFSDESPSELFQAPNRQNDRIWANNSSEVVIAEAVKQLRNILVRGMMS